MKKRTIGQQIKNLADLLRILGMAASILIGIPQVKSNPIFAILVIALGCYVAWASTLCLIGFGDLIDETSANRYNTDMILHILMERCGIENIDELQSETNNENKKTIIM